MTEQTKINCFMQGLKPVMKDILVSIVDCPTTLMGWENIIIQVNANLHQCDIECREEPQLKSLSSSKFTTSLSTPTYNPPATTSSDVVPMEVDSGHCPCRSRKTNSGRVQTLVQK